MIQAKAEDRANLESIQHLCDEQLGTKVAISSSISKESMVLKLFLVSTC
jgi:hypothetical protein